MIWLLSCRAIQGSVFKDTSFGAGAGSFGAARAHLRATVVRRHGPGRVEIVKTDENPALWGRI